MNKELLIKILDLLEESYPEIYTASELYDELEKYDIKEFCKVIEYLEDSKKARVHTDSEARGKRMIHRVSERDRLEITPEGIDFLSQEKLAQSNERRNDVQSSFNIIIAITSIIIALSTWFSLILLGVNGGIFQAIGATNLPPLYIGYFIVLIVITGLFIWLGLILWKVFSKADK